jgi:tetratricopeptide (TPR) repeat protein
MLSSTVKAWLLGLSLALGVAGLPQRVDAASHNSGSATTQRARRHFLAGKHAFEARRYPAALKEFEAGYAIEPRPGFLLNMGHAARRMGELKRARDYYLKFLESDPPAAERRSTIALVMDIDRQLASAQGAGKHASVSPEPAAVTPPPAVVPSVVETAAAPIEPLAVAAKEQDPPEAAPPRLIPAVAVRVTSAEAPPALSLLDAPSKRSAREESSPPIYRRWWFWVATGAAAGAATAIAISTLGSGASPRDSGTWGQIKL